MNSFQALSAQCSERVRCGVPGARLHGMSPSQRLGVGQVMPDSRDAARLDQRAELEVDGVHVGWPPGKWPKPPSGLRQPRAQSAPCVIAALTLGSSPPSWRRMKTASKQEWTSQSGSLMFQPPSGFWSRSTRADHLPGLRRGLADQSIEVGHVEGRGDVVAEVAVGGLVRLHVPASFFRHSSGNGLSSAAQRSGKKLVVYQGSFL